jgi:HAMP domain-containing protein
MSEVGPVAVDVALAVAAEVALGALAVLVLAHGRTRALIARGAARVARDARRLSRRPGAPAPGTGQIRGSAGS